MVNIKDEIKIADYEKAIYLNPSDSVLYFGRGVCYQILKINFKAQQDFSKAIELEPTQAQYYYSRGECYQALGDEAKAQADFAKAKELGYNS